MSQLPSVLLAATKCVSGEGSGSGRRDWEGWVWLESSSHSSPSKFKAGRCVGGRPVTTVTEDLREEWRGGGKHDSAVLTRALDCPNETS